MGCPVLASDYSSALGLLLRYPSPEPHSPVDFVRDSLILQQDLSAKGAASILSMYSRDIPGLSRRQTADFSGTKKSRNTLSKRNQKTREPQSHATTGSSTPGDSTERANQRGIDSLLQDVSGGLYRRTEGWGVAKAVRGAVGDARRNIQGMQSSASSPALAPANSDGFKSTSAPRLSLAANDGLKSRISSLESRNKSLAKQLGESLTRLRVHHESIKQHSDISAEELDSAFDTIQYVKSRLEDSAKPISDKSENNRSERSEGHPPAAAAAPERATMTTTTTTTTTTSSASASSLKSGDSTASVDKRERQDTAELRNARSNNTQSPHTETPLPTRPPPRAPPRAPLADSSFSWMLGDSGPEHSFMTCASAPPERKRESENRERPKYLFGDGRSKDERKSQGSEEGDGVVLNQLGGLPED